jgi:tRNA-guanine family transglycosylase
VQGGRYEDLRKESAKIIGGMDFDGFGIGGIEPDVLVEITKEDVEKGMDPQTDKAIEVLKNFAKYKRQPI